MATVTGLTAARMIEMENATVIDGSVVGDNLILETRDGTLIDAGSVRGPIGVAGASFIVCTSTTRPTLTAPEEGKAIYETDTNLIRVWTGARWRLQERIICTSTTRPAMVSGDEGVKIYETDTDIEFIWSGTAWLAVSPVAFADLAARTSLWTAPPDGAISYIRSTKHFDTFNGVAWVPLGSRVLGYAESFSQPTGIGATTVDISGLSIGAITLPAGRRHRLTARVLLTKDATAERCSLVIRDSSNVVFMQENLSLISTGTHLATVEREFITPSAATYTWKVGVGAVVGTVSVEAFNPTMPNWFRLEDIGPG